jgi:hypothetical protein
VLIIELLLFRRQHSLTVAITGEQQRARGWGRLGGWSTLSQFASPRQLAEQSTHQHSQRPTPALGPAATRMRRSCTALRAHTRRPPLASRHPAPGVVLRSQLRHNRGHR